MTASPACTQRPCATCGTSKDSRDLRKHPSERLSLKRPALAQRVEEVFSSSVGMSAAPQNPSNDTQSQLLTVTLEGSLNHKAFHVREAPCGLEEGPRWSENPGPRQGVEDTTTTGPSTQGPLAQHEGIPSGRKEMSPLPLLEPLLGSHPSVLCPRGLQVCVLRAHSPHSSPGPAAQACLLVLPPGPSAPP